MIRKLINKYLYFKILRLIVKKLNFRNIFDHYELWIITSGYDQYLKNPYFNSRPMVDIKIKDDYLKIVKKYYPESINKTIKQANQICGHVFDLLGSGKRFLGKEIDWNCDFKNEYQWNNNADSEKIDILNLAERSDIKIPWELSRFQHLVALGKAYWYSNDQKYLLEFQEEILNWIKNNEFKKGVNWTCSMEVAIRAVNWIWAYYFFAGDMDSDFNKQFIASLIKHGRFICTNLEYSWHSGNHLMANAVGLVYLGIFFKDYSFGRRWLTKGKKILFNEIKAQINTDGVHFEQSISYHRLVLEMCLSALLLCKHNDINVPQEIWDKLEKMFEFVGAYLRPDGSAPVIGDADNGRLHILTEDTRQNINDHSYLLSLGAVLFARADLKFADQLPEEAFWLLGKEGLNKYNELKKSYVSISREFSESGYYILRNKDYYMFVDCGTKLCKGTGGHGHNDLLSFELYAEGQSFVKDPGAYTYTEDCRKRNMFRSSGYHNTIVVDGQEINEIDEKKLFALPNKAKSVVRKWVTNSAYDYLCVEHYAYMRLANKVVVRREIYFDKKDKIWVLKDMIIGEGKNKMALSFHLEALEVVINDDKKSIVFKNDDKTRLLLSFLNNEINVTLEDGWISPSYGVKYKAPVITIDKLINDQGMITFAFLPLGNNGRNAKDMKVKSGELLKVMSSLKEDE